MKFGKRLQRQIQETLPEWRSKFISYKELKKLVKLISSTPARLERPEWENAKAEAEFIYLLNNEIDKFNGFFVEKEEDFIIRHQELKQRIYIAVDGFRAKRIHPSENFYRDEVCRIRRDIVDFHGEMILLINYSNVNYTGLAKILKKYDKRTGAILRLPFIQKVLEQPFFTTDLISQLVKECETSIDAVFSIEEHETSRESRGAVSMAEEGIFRNTVAALMTMQEIRKGSSTYSHFSLPPLNLPESDLTYFLQRNSPIPIP